MAPRRGTRWFALADTLSPLVLGLMDPDPGTRWDLDRATRFLADLRGSATTARGRHHQGSEIPSAPDPLDALIEGTISHFLEVQRPFAAEMWPTGTGGGGLYPVSVMFGASGVTAALLRADSLEKHGLLTPSRGRGPESLAKAIEAANRWYDPHLSRNSRGLLPGLYAGHAGLAWTAFDLATAVGDEVNQRRAVELAKALPVSWHIPDVYHGLAGAGLTLLHLWQATGDEQLGERARLCADALLGATTVHAGRTYWPLPAGPVTAHGSTSESLLYQGYAHGTAGLGTFFLLSAGEWDDPRYLEAALAAGHSLVSNATTESDWNGRPFESAWWNVDPTTPGASQASWCQGSAGIGGFLPPAVANLRGDHLSHTRRAGGRGGPVSARHSEGGMCHGLAGAGHFLLDLADVLENPRYREWSSDVARWMTARHSQIRNTPVLGMAVRDNEAKNLDFGSGSAGELDFLLRLRCGGRAPWLPFLRESR